MSFVRFFCYIPWEKLMIIFWFNCLHCLPKYFKALSKIWTCISSPVVAIVIAVALMTEKQ